MRHEYHQPRFSGSGFEGSGRSRDTRDNRDNEGDRDDYGSSNAPMEWDNRRYGRDFNDDPNDGGRGVYGGGRGNRLQGGNQGWYAGQEAQGSYGRRENNRDDDMNRSGFGESGRSNFGSSKYGGSDYSDNDYRRNESRYGSPYSSLSTRQQLGEDLSDHSRFDSSDSEVIGGNWNRSSGSGEWYGEDRAGTFRQTYGRSQPRSHEQYGYRGGSNQSQGFGQSQELGSERSNSFRGRGPKGYERSDERLKEIVCESLTDAPHIDASEISIEVKSGEVTLTGTVDDRRAKHAAEDLVEQCAGVKEIQNQLKIRSQSGSRSSTQQASDQGTARPGIARGVTQASTQGSTPASTQNNGKSDQDSNTASGSSASGAKNAGDKLSGKSDR